MNRRLNNIELITLLLIIILTCACFLPSMQNSVVNFDDKVMFVANPLVQVFSWNNIKGIFTSFNGPRYYPIALLSFQVDDYIFGTNYQFYHLENVILHLINAALLFYLLLRLELKIGIVFVTTLLFAIHPLHVEAVTWISSRKDVLYAFFYFLALIAYLNYKQRQANFLFVIMWLILSLLSKPMAITFPFILLLIDYYLSGKMQKRDLIQKIPYCIIVVVISCIALYAVDQSHSFAANQIYSFWERIILSADALGIYVTKLLAPHQLSVLYPLSISNEQGLLTAAIIGIILFLSLVILSIRLKAIRLPLFFFFISIFPVLHFVRINNSLIFERFVYVPSIGIFLIVALAIHWLWNKTPARANKLILIFSLSLYFILLGALTWQRTHIWKNSFTLWNDAIEKFPQNAMAYHHRAVAYSDDAQFDLAIQDLNTALALQPKYALAYYARGFVYEKMNDKASALLNYSRSIDMNPSNIKAWNNRGNIYSSLKKYDLAIKDYSAVLGYEPRNLFARLNRGLVYYKKNDLRKSLADFTKVVEWYPENTYAQKMRILIKEKLQMPNDK